MNAAQAKLFKDRLRALIIERYGGVRSKTIATLCRDAGISYTTLARFVMYSGSKRTACVRHVTINRLAIALRVTPAWLADGQGAQQLGFWPTLTPSTAEMEIQKPVDHIAFVMERLKELPEPILIRACRAALAAAVETLSREGHMAPQEAYRCLMRLDALQSGENYKVAASG